MKSCGENEGYLVCTWSRLWGGAVWIFQKPLALQQCCEQLKELDPTVYTFVRLGQRNNIKPSKSCTRNILPTDKCGNGMALLIILFS